MSPLDLSRCADRPGPNEWFVAQTRAERHSETCFCRITHPKHPGSIHLFKGSVDARGTLGAESGPNSTRRNTAVTTRDPVVGPNGFKQTSEHPEKLPYKAPYQNFHVLTGHSAAPGLHMGSVEDHPGMHSGLLVKYLNASTLGFVFEAFASWFPGSQSNG